MCRVWGLGAPKKHSPLWEKKSTSEDLPIGWRHDPRAPRLLGLASAEAQRHEEGLGFRGLGFRSMVLGSFFCTYRYISALIFGSEFRF